MTTPFVVLILSLLLGIQPVTTDLYLPALPTLTAGFGASIARAQLTLSGLLLAFGLSQLVWGPVSDRFGRRPVMLIGLTAYTVAALGSTLAPTMEALLLWRIVQGAAMGAAVMCARALVRDLYSPEVGARAISKGLSGLGVIACVSVPLGALLAEYLGWRAALAAIAVFGAATLMVVLMHFEETLQTPNPQALHPVTLFHTWAGILRHPTFWAFTLLATMSFGGLFTFLAASSFVLIDVIGLSKPVYGMLMFSMAVAYLLGTFLCRRLLHRFGVHRAVAIGGGLSIVGGTAMGVLGLVGVDGVWAIMLPVYVFMLGHGVHQPCGQSGAVGPFPHAAGAASALSGFLMMLSAFAIGYWLGVNLDGTRLPLTNGMWFWGVMTALVAWGLVFRNRPPPTPR